MIANYVNERGIVQVIAWVGVHITPSTLHMYILEGRVLLHSCI